MTAFVNFKFWIFGEKAIFRKKRTSILMKRIHTIYHMFYTAKLLTLAVRKCNFQLLVKILKFWSYCSICKFSKKTAMGRQWFPYFKLWQKMIWERSNSKIISFQLKPLMVHEWCALNIFWVPLFQKKLHYFFSFPDPICFRLMDVGVIVAFVFTISVFAFGAGTITWAYVGELLPADGTGLVVGVASSSNWAASFFLTFYYSQFKVCFSYKDENWIWFRAISSLVETKY